MRRMTHRPCLDTRVIVRFGFLGSSNPKISKKMGYIGLDASNPPKKLLDASNPPKKLSPNGCLLGLDRGGPHLFSPTLYPLGSLCGAPLRAAPPTPRSTLPVHHP